MEQQLQAVAKSILDFVFYMKLGTADENGQSWVSPVYFSSADYGKFYWISSPAARHSRNLMDRPQVSIVIFDSRVLPGTGQAVYTEAVAEQVDDSELVQRLAIYNGRFSNPAEHGLRLVQAGDVSGSGLYRLYRATARETWMLDPESHPDRRIPIKLFK